MLAGTPVKPPQLDEFFCANEAHLRAAGAGRIGLSEEAIWGSVASGDGRSEEDATRRQLSFRFRAGFLRSSMLWACLLLPSLPLDVFARALAPDDAARRSPSATGGHYPRDRRGQCRGARGRHPRRSQLISASLALAPDFVLRDRDPDAEARALAQLADAGRRSSRPAVSLAPPECGRRRDRRQPAAVRRPAAARRAARRRRARAGLRRAARASRPRRAPRCCSRVPDKAHARPGRRRRCAATAATRSRRCRSRSSTSIPTRSPRCALPASRRSGRPAALPRDALARRVGAEFVAILDRARGRVPDPRPPFVPPPRFTGTLELPAPVARRRGARASRVQPPRARARRLARRAAAWASSRLSLALAHERYVSVKTRRSRHRSAASRSARRRASPRI